MAQEPRAQAEGNVGQPEEPAGGVQQGKKRPGDLLEHAAERARGEGEDAGGPQVVEGKSIRDGQHLGPGEEEDQVAEAGDNPAGEDRNGAARQDTGQVNDWLGFA